MIAGGAKALCAALLLVALSVTTLGLAACDRSGRETAADDARVTEMAAGGEPQANVAAGNAALTDTAADDAGAAPAPVVTNAAPTSDEPTPVAWDAAAPFEDIAPDGYGLDSLGEVPPDEVAAIMAGRTVPLTTTTAVFASAAEPTQRITATLLSYGDAAGALAMYNTWFAEYGFIPVAERRQVPFGDQAECFDAGWPPFHAVVLREGPLFALVQADSEVPLERCAALLGELLAEATS